MTDESDRILDITELQRRLRDFVRERDWDQYHSPKNLSMALSAEGGELLELFQWLTQGESLQLGEEDHARVAAELADIQIYLLRLADVLDISLPEAVDRNMEENAEKYPIDLSKGNATKYSRRDTR